MQHTAQKKLKYSDLDQKPVLLFDGICNLCNASVQWALLRDPKGIFRYAALQSDTGQELLKEHGLDVQNFDTVVLIDQNKVFLRSDVPLEIVRRLGGLWSALYIFKIVPSIIRNFIYNWVAKNRYRWWGRREQCMMPRPEWKERFL